MIALYIRCVWANKFTLVGYACLLLSLVLVRLPGLSTAASICVIPSLFLLGITDFGRESMEAYFIMNRRLKGRYISREAASRYLRRIRYAYCRMKGYELALNDYHAAVHK